MSEEFRDQFRDHLVSRDKSGRLVCGSCASKSGVTFCSRCGVSFCTSQLYEPLVPIQDPTTGVVGEPICPYCHDAHTPVVSPDGVTGEFYFDPRPGYVVFRESEDFEPLAGFSPAGGGTPPSQEILRQIRAKSELQKALLEAYEVFQFDEILTLVENSYREAVRKLLQTDDA